MRTWLDFMCRIIIVTDCQASITLNLYRQGAITVTRFCLERHLMKHLIFSLTVTGISYQSDYFIYCL